MGMYKYMRVQQYSHTYTHTHTHTRADTTNVKVMYGSSYDRACGQVSCLAQHFTLSTSHATSPLAPFINQPAKLSPPLSLSALPFCIGCSILLETESLFCSIKTQVLKQCLLVTLVVNQQKFFFNLFRMTTKN